MNESTFPVSASNNTMTAKPIFAILYRPGPAWIPGRPLREQPLATHLAYMEALFKAGGLVFAGPFLDDSGGAAFVRAADEVAAAAICDGDPAVLSGVFIGEVRPWMSMFDISRDFRAKLLQQAEAERNAAVVRSLFKAVEQRNGEGVVRAYDEAIIIHEAPSLPYGGDYEGLPGAFGHATGYRRAWDPLQGNAERELGAEIIADPDRVVVLWNQKGRNPINGEVFEMPVASVYRMKDGRIIDSRMFHFDVAASRAFLNGGTAPATV
jgi:uncharacterized protein YciI/ketosteroid isomerase-like protein